MTKTEEYLPLPLHGTCSGRNKGAMDWIHEGLAAVANGSEIMILDPKSLEIIQLLTGHKASVTQILWLPAARQFTSENKVSIRDLISVDTNGQAIIWDTLRGQPILNFLHPDSTKQLLDMKLATGADLWVRSKVYMLYSGNLFVIFDQLKCTFQNIQIVTSADASQSSNSSDNIFKFSMDPNCANNASNCIAFLSNDQIGNSLLVCNSWDYLKDTRITIHGRLSLQLKGTSTNSNLNMNRSNSSGTLSPSLLGNQDSNEKLRKQGSSSASIRKLVSDIIVGPDNSNFQNPAVQQNGYMSFHGGIKDAVIISTDSHIYLINIQYLVIIHTFTLEKGGSSIIQVIPTKLRPCLVTLHENGTVYLRKYLISGTHNISVQLESICCSENPRFSSKKSEVLGCVIQPMEENAVVLYLSDGRFLRYEITGGVSHQKVGEKKKLLTTPATPYVRGAASIEETYTAPFLGLTDSMQSHNIQSSNNSPSKDSGLKNMIKPILESDSDNIKIKLKRVTNTIGQLTYLKGNDRILVAGTNLGTIAVMQVVKGKLKLIKKFSTHSSSPIGGIEFVSDNEILTYSNLSFSANPKCELILTDISTGASKALKMDESFHIQCIKVSPLKQYFVIVYKNGSAPCELWDLPRRQLIKTLPNKLPPITCVQWRDPVENIREETFYMTDLGTFLFTFRVEGNRFANATCVKLDTAGNMGGIPVSLFTRGSLVFRADSSGTLVIYNTEKKTASPGVNIGRGPLITVNAFDGYFVAQFVDVIELWDYNEVKKIKTLHSGKLKSSSVAVMGNYVAYIPKTSNGVKFLPLDLDQSVVFKTPIISSSLYAHFLDPKDKAFKILSIIKNATSTVQDVVDFTREISSLEEHQLWSLVSNKLSNSDFEGNVLDVFSDNRLYKEVLVKTAQCVWISDYTKRETVGRILLWAGETDKSAEILLDTEPSDYTSYVLNGLKASISVGSGNLPESTKAVLKIVATNLIACGETDGGLELLCLLGKHSEACKYVESSNEWGKALLLCKTSLTEQNAEETLCKYAYYLNSKKCVIKSASVYVYVRKFDRAIEVLVGSRLRHLSYLLLYFCEKQNIVLNISDHVRLAIKLDFARFLFDCGLMNEAIEFCGELGDNGKDLKQELEILAS